MNDASADDERSTNSAMNWDEDLCLCFHVTPRKVWNYLRVERPARASQLSECQGAGTGCGWCRRYLERMFAAWAADRTTAPLDELSTERWAEIRWPGAERNAARRAEYVRGGGGTPPPGATPLPPEG